MSRHLRAAGQNARINRLGKHLLASFGAVAETSKSAAFVLSLNELLRHSWDSSATESGTRQGLAVSTHVLRSSLVAKTVQKLRSPLDDAIDVAAVTRLTHWIEATVRASWLYRWLTDEPESEVIVIDLRETVSVGPAIAALDRLIRWLVPASHRSTVVGVAEYLYQSVIAAPIRATSFVLGVAVVTNLLFTMATAEPTQGGVVARVVLLGIAAIGTRVTMTWDELVRTRPVRLLVAALEPPESPNKREE